MTPQEIREKIEAINDWSDIRSVQEIRKQMMGLNTKSPDTQEIMRLARSKGFY